MSGLEVGRSPGTNVVMEPVRNPAMPPIRYGNQQLDWEDALETSSWTGRTHGLAVSTCSQGRSPGAGLTRLVWLKLQISAPCKLSTET